METVGPIKGTCLYTCLVALIVSDSATLLCVCAQSSPTLVTPWTVAHQAPLSMGFSRPECWSGFPCPSPGDLPNSGIKTASLVSPALPRVSVLFL